jgi:hypothetical protein
MIWRAPKMFQLLLKHKERNTDRSASTGASFLLGWFMLWFHRTEPGCYGLFLAGRTFARVETVRESARRKVFRDHFLARVNPQLRKDPMKMGMDRGAADTQCIRDLLVQKTCKNARENFFFAFR